MSNTLKIHALDRTCVNCVSGQPENASLINNFFSKEDLEYYTVPRGNTIQLCEVTVSVYGVAMSKRNELKVHEHRITMKVKRVLVGGELVGSGLVR